MTFAFSRELFSCAKDAFETFLPFLPFSVLNHYYRPQQHLMKSRKIRPLFSLPSTIWSSNEHFYFFLLKEGFFAGQGFVKDQKIKSHSWKENPNHFFRNWHPANFPRMKGLKSFNSRPILALLAKLIFSFLNTWATLWDNDKQDFGLLRLQYLSQTIRETFQISNLPTIAPRDRKYLSMAQLEIQIAMALKLWRH